MRNFLLLCTEKVTQDELFLIAEEAKAQDKKQDDPPKKIATRRGEHLYDPDQPRVPAGDPEGGQCTSDGSNGGGSSTDNERESTAKNSTKSDESSNKTESSDIEKTEAKLFEDLEEETRSFLEKEGLSEEEINEKLNDITLEGMTQIFKESFNEKFGNFNDIIENSDYPLFASNGSCVGLMPSKSTDLGRFTGENVSMWYDDDSRISYDIKKVKIDGNEIKLSFAISNKDITKTGGKDLNNLFHDTPDKGIFIQRESSALWITTTLKLEGFKANSNKTIVIDATYKYYDSDGNLKEDKITVVYDVKADKDGVILLERLGLLNVIPDIDKVSNFIDNDFASMDMTFDIYCIDGRSFDNYGNAEKIDWNRTEQNLCYQNVTDYLPAHANSMNYDAGNNKAKKPNGGLVGKQKSEREKIKISSININSEFY